MINKELVHKMELYLQNLLRSGDKTARFRATYYRAAIKELQTLKPTSKFNHSLLNELKLSDRMRERIIYISKLNKYAPELQQSLISQLTKIKGIGLAKSRELISNGLTSTKDLIKPKWEAYLSKETLINLKYEPVSPIPRDIITQIGAKLDKLGFDLTIVGSYRREKSYSSDIDVMVVCDKKEEFSKLRTYLLQLNCVFYAEGEEKYGVIFPFKRKYYKIDFFMCRPTNRASMLLYSTGSKEFNIKMRQIAKKKGYLLNQNGIYDDNKKIHIYDEQDVFDILDIKFIEPKYR
jgi:DNA polymerase/3'-5' exonuclease PolX